MRAPVEMLYRAIRRGLENFGLFYGVYKAQVVEVIAGDKYMLRVVCPAVSDEALPPARMRFQWAGTSHGWFVPFDVDDFVEITFDDGDAERPVVMGGWYAPGELPAAFAAVDGAYPVRGLITKQGLMLLFNDTSKTISAVHPSGDRIDITEDLVTAQNKSGSKIELTGTKIVGTAETIELAGNTDVAVLANELERFLMSSASFATSVGPSGPMTTPFPSSVKSTKVKLS